MITLQIQIDTLVNKVVKDIKQTYIDHYKEVGTIENNRVHELLKNHHDVWEMRNKGYIRQSTAVNYIKYRYPHDKVFTTLPQREEIPKKLREIIKEELILTITYTDGDIRSVQEKMNELRLKYSKK